MKFSCERCGKRYATAEDPTPGRVYKLKCKACGHLIVVKAPATAAAGASQHAAPLATPPPVPRAAAVPPPPPAFEAAAAVQPPPEARAEVQAAVAEGGAAADAPSEARDPPATPEPQPPGATERSAPPPDAGLEGASLPSEPPPEVELEVGAPVATTGAAPAAPPPAFGDRTTEVWMSETGAALVAPERSADAADGGAAAEAPQPGDGHASPDAGYVDLFSDMAGGDEGEKPSDDPFLAAARASLPDGYGEGNPAAPDPLGPLREPSPPAREQAPAPKVPAIPRPPRQRSLVPIALIAVGVLVLVGILAFVLLGTRRAPPPPPRPQAQSLAAPVAPPPLAPPAATEVVAAAAPQPEPAETDEVTPQPEAGPAEPDAASPPAAPARPANADRRARDERRRRDRAEAQERAAREREARELAAREQERQERARVAAAAASEEPEGALTREQIEGTIRSTKKAFDGCIETARGGGVTLDGRRVMLRLNIQPTGTVTYPTLDDVTLNGTVLGSCLKSAARLMVFPKFKGDTLHVEVPLVMR